jgi:hypothetical protein
MTCTEFYYSIDCQFPYHHEEAWKKIILEALEVCGDAPFLVLHEICRLPSSITLDLTAHLKIYGYWKSSFTDPIQDLIEPASLALMNQHHISDAAALEIMEKLRPYPKNYNALLMVLFASIDDRDFVENKYQDILSEWKKF